MLNKQRIITYLPSALADSMSNNIHIFSSISSTNDYLLTLPKEIPAPNEVCIALSQTAGRGQYDRQWFSPSGSNLYFSQRLRMVNNRVIEGITLIVGIILCQILREVTQLPCLVKWPNDIFLAGKKLAGILTEIAIDEKGNKYLIVGIGLNVSIPSDFCDQLPNATDLASHHVTDFDSELFLAKLITTLDHSLHYVIVNGWSHYYYLWRQYDVLWHQPVQVKTPAGDISGIAQGITETGHLQLLHQGDIKLFSSGQASIII